MRTEHLAETPHGWKVRTIRPGPRSEHEVRIAFPPGRRKKGSGKVVEILHPSGERANPACEVSKTAKSNPSELLIFGNPGFIRRSLFHQLTEAAKERGETFKQESMPDGRIGYRYQGKLYTPGGLADKLGVRWSNPSTKQATRERAARIRAARQGRGPRFRDVGRGNPYFSETIRKGHDLVVIWANTADGPFHVQPYVNDGETIIRERGKYKSLLRARKKAHAWLEGKTGPNPKRAGFGNHKKGCKCVFCEHQRKIAAADARMPKPIRDVMTNQGRLIDAIRHGDRVTIVNRFGQQRTGRAVMRSSSGGWVLNMGGPYGTPGLADDRNVVRVKRSKNPVRMLVFHDPAIKKFTAAIYDPKFGNLYASGYTKKQAAQALRERVREYRRSGSVPAGGGYGNPSVGTRVTISEGSGIDSGKTGVVIRWKGPRDQYSYRDESRSGHAWVRLDSGGERIFPKNRLRKANPLRATPRRRRADRRNPDQMEKAVQLFQSFHGRDPKEVIEKHVSATVRLDYTTLGDLGYLKVITPLGQIAQFSFEDDAVKLASSPDGKQLYCIGGNQNLGKCLDADSLQKDFIDLGECTEVQYLARKVHANFEPVDWFHKFGEKTGARPQLMYDKLKKQIFFVGGEYFIDTSKGVSPGIEN